MSWLGRLVVFWDSGGKCIRLLPWADGTALIQSLAVTKKRGTFKSWTALWRFSRSPLSFWGTFLVRSGVLTSVHAFANCNPSSGALSFSGVAGNNGRRLAFDLCATGAATLSAICGL